MKKAKVEGRADYFSTFSKTHNVPGSAFTTLHFLRNLRISRIS